jgi:hypothetical protein
MVDNRERIKEQIRRRELKEAEENNAFIYTRTFTVFICMLLGCLIAGIALPGWQSNSYLRHGTWTSLSTLWLITPLLSRNSVSSLNDPESWFGLQQILAGLLNFIPAALPWMAGWFLMAYGILQVGAEMGRQAREEARSLREKRGLDPGRYPDK